MDESVHEAFRTTVDDGHRRMNRTWPQQLATGTVGGIDVSVGVLAALLVYHESGSSLLAALAFTIGFVALTLGNSELFTENFLVPIVSVTAGKGRLRDIARLWSGTALMNLVGGGLVMFVGSIALPDSAPEAAERGLEFVSRGVTWEGFASAVVAGMVITLMTWMQQGATAPIGQIVAAIGAAFILAAGHLNHVIVASLEVFGGIFSGEAAYSWGTWASQVWLWALGNAIGGIGLVTVLRLVQVGRREIADEQERPTAPGERDRLRQRDDDRSGWHANDRDDDQRQVPAR